MLESEFHVQIPELEFLQKPYRPTELVERVNELLARPETVERLRTREQQG